MIYRNSDLSNRLSWERVENPEAGERVRNFLEGELDLLRLARVRTTAIVALNVFLETADDRDLSIERSVSGQLLVTASDSGESLLVTGKTAEVLNSYLEDDIVLTDDRLDMTIRRATDR